MWHKTKIDRQLTWIEQQDRYVKLLPGSGGEEQLNITGPQDQAYYEGELEEMMQRADCEEDPYHLMCRSPFSIDVKWREKLGGVQGERERWRMQHTLCAWCVDINDKGGDC